MLTRRKMTVIAAATFFASQVRAQAPTPSVNAFDAWVRLFAGPPGERAWWFAGTVFAHVDGLREFPIFRHNAVRLCRTAATADQVSVEWIEIGCLRDLLTGAAVSQWLNPFTGETSAAPAGFVQGPGRYTARRNGTDVLAATEEAAQIEKIALAAQLMKGRLTVTVNESKIRGFPRLEGGVSPPDPSLPDVTEDKTNLMFVGDPAVLAAPPTAGSLAPTGMFNTVWDDLPRWLGFGDRLGGVLVKGLIRCTGLDAVPDATVMQALKRLHPRFFRNGRLRMAAL